MKLAEEVISEHAGSISMCSLRVGAGLFGIDTRQVREVLGERAPQPVPLAPDYIAGVLPYRGEVLTTVSFRELLGLDRWNGTNCVLVLDDEENDERFGLMVDSVGGVLAADRTGFEPNPSQLDLRSLALFDGAYRMQTGLMVRLDSRRLRPSQLAKSGLFGELKQEAKGTR